MRGIAEVVFSTLAMGGLTVGLVIALAAMFWRAQRSAKAQSTLALARQLALQADLLKREQLGRLPQSILLAIESIKLVPSIEAEQAVAQSIELIPRRTPRNTARITHAAPVTAVAFYPFKGKEYLATGTEDGTLQLWNVPSGKAALRTPLKFGEVCVTEASSLFSCKAQYRTRQRTGPVEMGGGANLRLVESVSPTASALRKACGYSPGSYVFGVRSDLLECP